MVSPIIKSIISGEPLIQRPYRLYDATNNRFLRWRCFKHLLNAHNAALIECRWLKVATTIEIFDLKKSKALASYSRGVNSVSYRRY